jgi:hypothetical protein
MKKCSLCRFKSNNTKRRFVKYLRISRGSAGDTETTKVAERQIHIHNNLAIVRDISWYNPEIVPKDTEVNDENFCQYIP